MMLKALLFAILAVAQVLAKSDKNAFGQCTKDGAKMNDIQAKMTQLTSTLTEAAENSKEDLTRMFQSESLDNRVFKKMCSVAPDVISDIDDLSEVVASCYNPAQQSEIDEIKEIGEGIVEDTINFVCDDDGAKIIKFLEEDGLDCLKSQENDIGACFDVDPETKVEQDATDEIHECIMNALNKCSSSTPAKIFDEWYKKIRHNIPKTASGSESDSNDGNDGNDDGASDGKKKKNKKKGKSSSSIISPTSINLLPIIYLVVAYFN